MGDSKNSPLCQAVVYSDYKKQWILYPYFQERRKALTIARILRSDGLKVTRQGVADFLKHFESTPRARRQIIMYV